MQTPLLFKTDILSSWGNDLNLEQTYKGCLSVLQTTQLPSVELELVAKEVTVLPCM